MSPRRIQSPSPENSAANGPRPGTAGGPETSPTAAAPGAMSDAHQRVQDVLGSDVRLLARLLEKRDHD